MQKSGIEALQYLILQYPSATTEVDGNKFALGVVYPLYLCKGVQLDLYVFLQIFSMVQPMLTTLAVSMPLVCVINVFFIAIIFYTLLIKKL